jgi:hypothetical protein
MAAETAELTTQTTDADASLDRRVTGLRRFNGVMGGIHLAQAALMLVLSTAFALPVMTYFLQLDPATGKLVPNPTVAFELPIGPLVALFLLISAVAHFLIASPPIYPWYARNIKRGVNYARWAEYALSSSVMIVIIAMLAGIYDIAALLVLFTLNATMNLFGWMMELHNQTTKKTDWTSYIFGVIAGIVPWIAIAIYLFGAGSGDARPPTFVYVIFGSIFVFFNVFAINMILQYKKVGRWRDYLFGERVYIILSLVAKSLLAWQVFFGTLRPM